MTEVEFNIPPKCHLRDAEALIEATCLACGLRIAMKGTLRSYAGCVHWHLKQGDNRGTLELTLWPMRHRIWASVQDGRRAPWIEEALPRLKRAVETALRNAAS